MVQACVPFSLLGSDISYVGQTKYNYQYHVKVVYKLTSASARRISDKRGAQLKLCATPSSPFKGNISVAHYMPLSTPTQGIENDVSARLQDITSASCDLELIFDLLTPESTVHALARGGGIYANLH